MPNKNIVIFWMRRDLRLVDNAAFYHALKSGYQVLVLFIFDSEILNKLSAKDDARVTFIYQEILKINDTLQKNGSSLLIKYGSPKEIWRELLQEYRPKGVFSNEDYEAYAKERDGAIAAMLNSVGINFYTFKDQVIFNALEVLKDDGSPYVVFTPYKRKWLQKLNSFYLKAYPTEKYFGNLFTTKPFPIISLESMGFLSSDQVFPDKKYKEILKDYALERDFPAKEATSRISLHLRFGTISIRQLAKDGQKYSDVWLSELIWRDFYFSILYHFPNTQKNAFRQEYDHIKWRNNEKEFKAWCDGKTGYPIVDAGMRQLNQTGFMHNRVRMIVASFLTKHLLIDWRWGEKYFADKLLDYEASSNIGGWQWAAGCGVDAAPYFRIFNPYEQVKKFDAKFFYIKKWVPEFQDPFRYPPPIVEHKFARERCLRVYKAALN